MKNIFVPWRSVQGCIMVGSLVAASTGRSAVAKGTRGLPPLRGRPSLRHRGALRARPTIQAFREKNILVGRPFPPMLNHLRVSVGRDEDMAKFLVAFKEIFPKRAAATSMAAQG